MSRALGRNTPSDFSHVVASPLDASALVTPRSVTIGVNWYTDFDPENLKLIDGSYHLPEATAIKGTIRGGHCVSLAPMGFANTPAKVAFLERLWVFYNQLKEGACEGFGHSHSQSVDLYLTEGKALTFDALQLYDNGRRVEGRFPTGEGACNKGIVEALLAYGISPQSRAECAREEDDSPYIKPVSTVKWTKDAQEVCAALNRPGAEAVPLLNSWGREYPMVVWCPVSTLARVLDEDGEADCCVG